MTEKKKDCARDGIAIGFGIFSLIMFVLFALFPRQVKTIYPIFVIGYLSGYLLINLIDFSQEKDQDDGKDAAESKKDPTIREYLAYFLINPLLQLTVFCLVFFCRLILNATFTVTKTWFLPFRVLGSIGLFLAGWWCFIIGTVGAGMAQSEHDPDDIVSAVVFFSISIILTILNYQLFFA